MLRLPAPALFLLPALALLPFGRGVEVPILVLAILGAMVSISGAVLGLGAILQAPLLLYGTFIVPMLLALPDAVQGDKSLLTTVGSTRYLFSTLGLLWLWHLGSISDREQILHLLGAVTAGLLTFWCLDGLWQFFTGENVLGYSMHRGYINGIFGDGENIKFGLTIALLLPVGLVHALRYWPRYGSIAFLLLTLVLLVLSGKRAAWIIALVQLALLGLYYWNRRQLTARRVAGALLVIAAAVVLAYSTSDWVKERSDILWSAAAERDYETLNSATGLRLPIWGTAARIARDHWINGVGPRGFRYAYDDYAANDDRWAEPLATGGARASHSHQLLLEIACETGVIGLAGWLLFVFFLLRLWWRAGEEARSRALPFGLSLAGMLFPINTHPAWYSSWFSSMLWLLVAMYLYAICSPSSSPILAGKD